MGNTDVLVLTKCCFCIPLRYGLLTWAYIKLISIGTLSGLLVYILVTETTSKNEAWYIRVLLALLFVEFCLTLMFIVATHKKHVRLMRFYYSYCIVMLVMNAVLMMVVLTVITPMFSSPTAFLSAFKFFCNLVIQCYFILVLRSEIVKLEDLMHFKSNNLTAIEAGNQPHEAVVDNKS